MPLMKTIANKNIFCQSCRMFFYFVFCFSFVISIFFTSSTTCWGIDGTHKDIATKEKNPSLNNQSLNEKNKESAEDAILLLAKGHFKLASENIKKEKVQLLDYGKRWSEFIGRMNKALMQFKTIQEAITFGEKKVNFTHRGNASALNLNLYEQQLMAEFPQFSNQIRELSDTNHFMKESIIDNNGIKKSNILYYYMHTLFACLSQLKNLTVVAEIGPGFGELARLWMINSVHSPKNYILIDAPESLFFAEIFLSSAFGSENIFYISSNKINYDEFKKYKFILCPVQFLKALEKTPIDLVINTGSLQEMSENWVDFWMAWLDKSEVRFLYSLNYFAQDISNMGEGGNSSAPRLSKKWVHKIQRSNPYWIRLQTERNYGEILAEKQDDVKKISQEEFKYGRRILNERYMDGTVFMELLDLYRRSEDPKFGFELLKKAFANLRPIPKELFYLSEKLEKESLSFPTRDLNDFKKIKDEIKILRENGNEGFTADNY